MREPPPAPPPIGSYYNHFHLRSNVSHAHESGHVQHTHDEFSSERFGTCVGIPCTYDVGAICRTEASEEVWCGEEQGSRTFCARHAGRVRTYRRGVRRFLGREAGHQIAIDALVALASAPYPTDFIDSSLNRTVGEVVDEKQDFDRAARRELLKTVQESITDSSAFAEQEGVQELSEEEGRALFRKQCWRWLGLSAEEFVRKWRADEFDDPDRPEVMRVAMLLPLFDKD